MKPMAVTIEPLLAHPQHMPFVADLVYREFWAGVEGGLTLDYLLRAFGGRAEPGRVLASLVALEHGAPLGCVHLIDHDDSGQPGLHPWLAAMVVVPERRGQGVGSALVRALLAEARAQGFERLWLGSDGPGFYERLGAVRERERGPGFWTLRFDLVPAP
jgi:predicted N-acetyltransferase YhbS